MNHRRNATNYGWFGLNVREEIMKTKSLWFAVLASAALSAQAQTGTVHPARGGIHRGPVPPAAAAVHAQAPAGGFPSIHSMPTRSFGGRMIHPGQRYSSF